MRLPIPAVVLSLLACSLLLLLLPSPAMACNKVLCASDVSKCLLQELCQCKPALGNCSCCRECMLCLSTMWDDCCDCVGMCKPRNKTDSHPTAKSSVEELSDPIPSLFRALTERETTLNWNVRSFPVAEELSHAHHLLLHGDTGERRRPGRPRGMFGTWLTSSAPNCTVVFFNECLSINKCRMSCESVGASKYRWFHNACCECVGPDCLDYGSKHAQCLNCMV
ncbi:unnamed protein product [Lampetra planeri]